MQKQRKTRPPLQKNSRRSPLRFWTKKTAQNKAITGIWYEKNCAKWSFPTRIFWKARANSKMFPYSSAKQRHLLDLGQKQQRKTRPLLGFGTKKTAQNGIISLENLEKRAQIRNFPPLAAQNKATSGI